ncbi:MAG: Ankyrin repeat protein 17 [Chthonomonadales bacterium]|nr:Ankyrin repeat protein 17 [Chthonomonadales bacterium]
MDEADADARYLKDFKNQIRNGEAEVVLLLHEGADPNVRDTVAVNRGFWEEVEFLLKRMLRPPSASTTLPRSALAFAVQAKNTAIATALLKAGANDVNAEVETHSGHRYTLVNYSAYSGNLEITRELCAHGADLRLNSSRDSILQSALGGRADISIDLIYSEKNALKQPEIVRRTEIFHLLEAKEVTYKANSGEGYALLLIAAAHGLPGVTRELLAAGVPPDAKPMTYDAREDSPLDVAVYNDDLPLVQLLLQYGASTRRADADSPMLYVRSPQVAKLLLAHGADLHAVCRSGKFEGRNALDFACTRGDAQAVTFLIEHGFNVNPAGEYGGPLCAAVGYGGIETVRVMLKHGAKVGPNSPGEGALAEAIAGMNDDIALLLLRYGAAVNTKEDPPLTAAAEQDDLEMARELLLRGAKANADKGKALLAACESCDEDLVEMLLEHGANPNVRSWDGSTAIQIARYSADPPSDADGIIALLKRYGVKR